MLRLREICTRNLFIELVNIPTLNMISPGVTSEVSKILSFLVKHILMLIPKRRSFWGMLVSKLREVHYILVLFMIDYLAKMLNLPLKSY